MCTAVSLSELVQALELDVPCFVDRATGQIVKAPDADSVQLQPADAAEKPEQFAQIPRWTQEEELELARRFAADLMDRQNQQRLNIALASSDALEAFQAAVFRCSIANEWFQARDWRLLDVARSWLEAHGIAWIDDVAADAS